MPADPAARSPVTPDVPGVLLPPPLILIAMLVAGVGLQALLPLGWLSSVASGWRIGIGSVVSLVGLSVIVRAVQTLRRHATNVNPYQPSLTIVTSGIYARTRNPIYVGGITVTLGIALIFALDWLLLVQLPGWAVLHFGVVLREERYLEGKFGGPYAAYKKAVRRYL